MHLAFYAPMKPPDHPKPSGDRTIARALLRVLDHMGAKVSLASRLRSRDGSGDLAVQDALVKEAKGEIGKILRLREARDWQAWITYHNYYKAPDLIGPEVAARLCIPYVQIESTRAKKRLGGAWDRFARAAEAAADAANLVFFVSERDGFALKRDAPQGQQVKHLRPFLPRETLPKPSTLDGPMVSVGMMRAGDKHASYQIIADTLRGITSDSWRLSVAGDGPMRGAVEDLLSPFGDRVTFLGMLQAPALEEVYAQSSLLLWPGVNEALGQVYLEAQAAGVPVVAQDRPGMRELLAPGHYPSPEAGPAALAAQADALLLDTVAREHAGKTARQFVATQHLLPAAAQSLSTGLASIGVTV